MGKNKRKWTPEEEQKFEQVKITDDLMFGTVFRNEADCKELLESGYVPDQTGAGLHKVKAVNRDFHL